MKVKRDGREKPWSADVHCRQCDSDLEADATDVKFSGDTDYTVGFYVICPICDAGVYLKDSTLPVGLRHKAREAYSASRRR